MIEPLTFLFKDDGKVPNDPALAALVYKAAVDPDRRDLARSIERHFAGNGWGHGQWRNGIYPFVHYHSMTHEAPGIAQGRARVQLGGHSGETLEFAAGDVAVLPAGTGASEALRQRRPPGHRRLSAGRHLQSLPRRQPGRTRQGPDRNPQSAAAAERSGRRH